MADGKIDMSLVNAIAFDLFMSIGSPEIRNDKGPAALLQGFLSDIVYNIFK